MPSQLPPIYQVWDITGAQQSVLPIPQISTSAPTASMGATRGQIIIVPTAGTAYILTSGTGANNNAVWKEITNAGGGPGNFSSLVVAPGPVTMNDASPEDVSILDGASAGDITINAGTGNGDITIGNTAAGAISLNSGAASEFVVSGAGFDLDLVSLAGSVNISGGEAAADAINIDSTGGVDVDAALQINLTSSQNSATAISLNASAGGVEINADGAATEPISIFNQNGSISLASARNAANAIALNSSGSISLTSTDSNGGISLQSQWPARPISISSDGPLNISSTSLLNDVTLDAAAGISIDAGAASNFSAAAGDLTLAAATNSVVISAAEAVADGIQLSAVGGVRISAAAANGITFTNGTQSAQILVGTGSPNGSVSGLQGSIFLNVGGAADTILYVNTDGAMSWTALTST